MKTVILTPEQATFLLECVSFARQNAEVSGWGEILASFEGRTDEDVELVADAAEVALG